MEKDLKEIATYALPNPSASIIPWIPPSLLLIRVLTLTSTAPDAEENPPTPIFLATEAEMLANAASRDTFGREISACKDAGAIRWEKEKVTSGWIRRLWWFAFSWKRFVNVESFNSSCELCKGAVSYLLIEFTPFRLDLTLSQPRRQMLLLRFQI